MARTEEEFVELLQEALSEWNWGSSTCGPRDEDLHMSSNAALTSLYFDGEDEGLVVNLNGDEFLVTVQKLPR